MFTPENLISDEYRDLNSQMHREKKYGFGGSDWTDKVEQLRNELKLKTVLDYGCGQGTLGAALGNPDWFCEYDPAIPGKEYPPRIVSDLVVCTDVLEHIEPDKLDSVLKHINSLSRNLVFFSISTVPAEKHLSDGRNAHINLHDAKWWRAKLESIPFLIAQFHEYPNGITVLCSSTRELMDMVNKSAVSDTIRREQSFLNCAKTSNRVKLGVPAHDGRAVIVCYGPSLQNTWFMIARERKLYGAKIVTVSGAHDFLISKGIIPDIHMECDPREHKGFFTKTPHPDVEYQMASCCHPDVIDNLLPHKLSFWHVYNSQEDLKIIEDDGPDPSNVLVGGGGSIGCRAVNVMYLQGYRSFSIYGFDCSFSSTGKQHAGTHSGKVQHQWAVKAGDRWFNTSGNMLYIARSFISNMSSLYKTSVLNGDPIIDGQHSMEIYLHGDGLLQYLYSHKDYDPKEVNWQNGNRVVEEESLEMQSAADAA